MENKTIKVLLIEDSIDDAELIKRMLEKSDRSKFQVTVAQKLNDGLEQAKKNPPDLILSDLGLPDSHGIDTVTKILLTVPHKPLVVLSGFDDEDIAIKAVQLGAQDYLVKGQIENHQLERAIYHSIERARLHDELEQNAQEISKLHANFLHILENNADAIIVVGETGRILFTNPAIESIFARKPRELLRLPFQYPLEAGKTSEIKVHRADEKITIAEMSVVNIIWEGNPAYLVSMHDITKRKQMENALRESEEKFSKAFLNSPQAILITSLDEGVILEANDTFLHLTGYSRKELVGKKAIDLDLWNSSDEREKVIKTLSEQGIVKNLERQFRKKSGEVHTWLFSAETINIDNKPCMLSVTVDITERKKIEEQLRFSDIAFKSIHEGILTYDNDHVITRWNKTCEEIMGIKASEAIGKPIEDLVHLVEEYPGQNEERLKVLKARGVNREEQIYRTPRGDIWVDVQAQAIEDNGKRTGWVTLFTDITARKQTEEALKQSEEKYREIINTSTDAIISTNPRMNITIFNHGAERIFGYKEKEILGQSIMVIFQPEQYRKVSREIVNLKDIGTSQFANKIFETSGFKKDFTNVPIEVSLSTRKVEDNFIITMIIRDITVRKEAEEKLRKIDQMKSEFLSNVSHELRTPLQSISGFTKLILTGKVPDPIVQQEFLQIVDRETAHLGNLINSLLDMSRLEAGRFQIYKKPNSVSDIFTDSIKMFHSLAREKSIMLKENIPADLPKIEVDSERMRQVIINLLSNALKFSEPGSTVNVKVAVRDGDLLFQVTDHGTGIQEEAMKHLFERFYRVEGETVRGGTGLGLYISKQIIDAHGGRIWVESKFGQGSTFSFTLPLNNTKGGNENVKENSGNRRRPRNAKTGRLLAKARGIPGSHGF
jgi:PAS domain S-box-containing protein